MTEAGIKSEWEGMELILTNTKRIVIKSKDKPLQRLLIWTGKEGDLHFEGNTWLQ